MQHYADLPTPVTPLEAKHVWDGQRHPSSRRVAKALTQAGRSVHFTTVARWKAQGWRPVASDQHAIETARTSLDAAIPLLTADPTMTANVFVEQDAEQRKKLEQLDDKELLKRAVRELAIVVVMIAQALHGRLDTLVGAKMAELAVLVRSLSACLKAVTAGVIALNSEPVFPIFEESAHTDDDPLEAAWARWDAENERTRK